jgi:hypothetical protein
LGWSPRWWACLTYGVATTALPAFWMFPAMGFGLFGSRAPQEMLLSHRALESPALRSRPRARAGLCGSALPLDRPQVDTSVARARMARRIASAPAATDRAVPAVRRPRERGRKPRVARQPRQQ